MRLFVAVPIPEPAAGEVRTVLDRLVSLGWPVRWIGSDGLHVTLKFFGEVLPARCGTIAEMVGFAAAGVAPFTLGVRGAGGFPDLVRPRVLHLDLVHESGLEVLQERMERGGERIGFPPEGRPFQPHITLGRVREGHRLPAGAREYLEGITPIPAVRADRVVLFESVLPTGNHAPSYVARSEVMLTG